MGVKFENGKLVSDMDVEELERKIGRCMNTGEFAKYYKNKDNTKTIRACSMYLATDPVQCPYLGNMIEVLKRVPFGEQYINERIYTFECERDKGYKRLVVID